MRVIDLKRELEKLPDHAAIEVIEDSITITYQVQAQETTEAAVEEEQWWPAKQHIINHLSQKAMHEEAQRIAREVTDLHKQNQDNPEEPKPFKPGDPIAIWANGILWQGTYNQKINGEWSEITVELDDTNEIWQVLTEELKHAGEQP